MDREICEQERDYCRQMVEFLKQNWEKKEKEQLQRDIEAQLKQNAENAETPLTDLFARFVEEEEKDLPSNEEVEKVKSNEKLYELEMNTLRI